MKMVFALLFFVIGEIIEEQTLCYLKKSHCLYMCQELSRPSNRYDPVDCRCKARWVDINDVVIR